MRLQKYLAHAGVTSRRKSEELITAGRVKVNDEIVSELGQKIDPLADKVFVDGYMISTTEEKVYYLLNKPKGYVTTLKDEKNRPTIIELINTKKRIYPVGRLDLKSRGLLLMTNDGTIAFRLTHPSYKIPKTYHVTIKGKMAPYVVDRLLKGITLKDGFSKPQKVEKLNIKGDKTIIKIVLNEGRKRQVRRMLKKVGYPVLDLVRTEFANLNLKGLPEGNYRQLSEYELNELKKLIKLK